MPQWMDELDELIKGMGKPAPPADDEDQDDEAYGDEGDDEDQDDQPPVKKAASSRKGCYPAADNGDDDDQPEGAAVRDPEKIERKTKGGKITKPAGVNAGSQSGTVAKSVRDLVDGDSADVIDASSVLGAVCDAVDNMAAQIVARMNKSMRRFDARLDEIEAGQSLIGQAVSKSLQTVTSQVEAIGAQPRGRKAVTKAVERFAEKNETPAPTRDDLMVKSLAALKAGRINATEAASVDAYLNGNRELGRAPMLPPSHLMAKINGS
jgi:hypothetical protein